MLNKEEKETNEIIIEKKTKENIEIKNEKNIKEDILEKLIENQLNYIIQIKIKIIFHQKE